MSASNPRSPVPASLSIDRRTFLAAGAAGAAAIATGCSSIEPGGGVVTMERKPYGPIVDGRPVEHFRLTAENGTEIGLTNYGAIVTHVRVKDRSGQLGDVALGFDDLDGYLAGSPYFGCIAGRCANRIAKGTFDLDGKTYSLACNNGPNHLHGGVKGFDKRMWNAEPIAGSGYAAVVLTRRSPAGEEGYPGNLDVKVTYQLTTKGDFRVDMEAVTDAPTLVNLVHHTYWNLAGHDSGDVLAHELTLPCSRYTPADATLIPTGKLAPVAGTPFDFTQQKAIGRDIAALKAEAGAGHGGGYDLNYAVDGADGEMRLVARAYDPRSGRVLEVHADQPGLQFYSGNFLDGSLRGKGGAVYRQHAGLCLESQKFPDAIHHPDFPSCALRPGVTYRHAMVHRFKTA